MGFFLTILYLVTAYLGPETIFGPLAAIHISIILAALVFLVSLPSLTGSLILKTPQSLALIGLAFAVFISVLLTGWASGAADAFLKFIPNAFAYFVVCLHCNTKKRLKIIAFMLLLVCLFIITKGYYDLLHGFTESPYLLGQRSDAGDWFYRLRGLDFISDPNDFAQLIVCVIPLIFIFWQAKRTFKNIVCVILPVCALLFGAFLTHSRGSVLALMAITVVAVRRRIGTVLSLGLAAGLFVTASALHFTGGREISADAGSGRLDLWSAGLQLLKSHPLFGVGFDRMAEYGGLTAHNSMVVCAAELGLFGLYLWSLFLLPTVRDALTIASPVMVSEGTTVVSVPVPFQQATTEFEALEKTEINRLGRIMILSFTGFLVAAWFLSRAFTMTLFLLGGFVEVIYEMGARRGMIAPRLPLSRVLRYSAMLAFGLLLLMYLMLRTINLRL